MRNQLPSRISRIIHQQPNLKIIWWGRRAAFEIVEEVSEALFRLYILFGLAYNIWPTMGKTFGFSDEPWKFWSAIFIIAFPLAGKAMVEIIEWRHEIFVIVIDEVNGGGRIYKFWSYLRKLSIDDAIAGNSPSVLAGWDNSIAGALYQLWGKITGERMEKVALRTLNNTYIEGRKMPPAFLAAISGVRGHRPEDAQIEAGDLKNLQDIKAAVEAGLIDVSFARHAAIRLIGSKVGFYD